MPVSAFYKKLSYDQIFIEGNQSFISTVSIMKLYDFINNPLLTATDDYILRTHIVRNHETIFGCDIKDEFSQIHETDPELVREFKTIFKNTEDASGNIEWKKEIVDFISDKLDEKKKKLGIKNKITWSSLLMPLDPQKNRFNNRWKTQIIFILSFVLDFSLSDYVKYLNMVDATGINPHDCEQLARLICFQSEDINNYSSFEKIKDVILDLYKDEETRCKIKKIDKQILEISDEKPSSFTQGMMSIGNGKKLDEKTVIEELKRRIKANPLELTVSGKRADGSTIDGSVTSKRAFQQIWGDVKNLYYVSESARVEEREKEELRERIKHPEFEDPEGNIEAYRKIINDIGDTAATTFALKIIKDNLEIDDMGNKLSQQFLSYIDPVSITATLNEHHAPTRFDIMPILLALFFAMKNEFRELKSHYDKGYMKHIEETPLNDIVSLEDEEKRTAFDILDRSLKWEEELKNSETSSEKKQEMFQDATSDTKDFFNLYLKKIQLDMQPVYLSNLLDRFTWACAIYPMVGPMNENDNPDHVFSKIK